MITPEYGLDPATGLAAAAASNFTDVLRRYTAEKKYKMSQQPDG